MTGSTANLSRREARLRAEEREARVIAALGGYRLRSFAELRMATRIKGRFLRGALDRLERKGTVRSQGERGDVQERFWRV